VRPVADRVCDRWARTVPNSRLPNSLGVRQRATSARGSLRRCQRERCQRGLAARCIRARIASVGTCWRRFAAPIGSSLNSVGLRPRLPAFAASPLPPSAILCDAAVGDPLRCRGRRSFALPPLLRAWKRCRAWRRCGGPFFTLGSRRLTAGRVSWFAPRTKRSVRGANNDYRAHRWPTHTIACCRPVPGLTIRYGTRSCG
jgi:hypothetical protein